MCIRDRLWPGEGTRARARPPRSAFAPRSAPWDKAAALPLAVLDRAWKRGKRAVENYSNSSS
eukprot:10840444-Alexandrium_andersonii.AAC.1